MGYYANGSGSIEFSRTLTEKEIDLVYDVLSAALECEAYTMHCITRFDIWGNEKYYGDTVMDALSGAARVAPIHEGEIDYVGEDGELWRLIYRDGNWIEESGRVVYESEPAYHDFTPKAPQTDEAWAPNDKDAFECLYQ